MARMMVAAVTMSLAIKITKLPILLIAATRKIFRSNSMNAVRAAKYKNRINLDAEKERKGGNC